MPSPTLELLVAHNATILADETRGLGEHYLRSAGPARIARAASTRRQTGVFTLGDYVFPFYRITHGGPENLPPPQKDTYRIVSKLTIQAAMHGGRPIHDLFFLYGDQRDPVTNRYLGVIGLGRPQPIMRQQESVAMPRGVLGRQWRNTCPYPAKLYMPGLGLFVDGNLRPTVSMAVPPPAAQTHVQYDHELNERFTALFDMPVYDTEVAGVRGNTAPTPNTETLLVANPNVSLALGAVAAEQGYVVLEPGIRAQDTRSLLGGAGAGMYDESVLCGPLI